MTTSRWVALGGVGMLLGIGAACAKPGPPPAAADAPIALDGEHTRLELLDDKYLHYTIGASIAAPPDVVWAVLTDAPAYPSWNSTIVSVEGTIAAGETIALTAKIDPKRTFDLEITTFEPASRMVWEDGNNAFKGTRTFTLTARSDGGTDFTMREAFTGAMLKMIAKKLPDFGPDFDAFAADLEREAERRAPPPPPAPEPAPTVPEEALVP